MELRSQGQFKQADFFENIGGLNLTDSPFRAPDSQATGGQNYEYALTGGIRKRNGHTKLNSVADAALKALGVGLHIASNGTKKPIRAAGTRIQAFADDTYAFTNLTEDTTAAGSTFLDAASTQQVVMSQFDTSTANTLWMVGGGIGAGKVYGAYSATKVTQNGAAEPGGTMSLAAGGAAGTIATGTYYYSLSLRKASTQAESNAALDQSVAVTLGQKVTVTLSSLTVDTTKYDKIFIYRSAVSGVSGFTAGVLVATVNSTEASYLDGGTVEDAAAVVPRADNLALDNSVLPSTGTYLTLTTFKRRLVTAAGSTLHFSDLNKPESWPTQNTITIPSGGAITGMSVISYNTASSGALDEILVIFKERELWIITGTDEDDWELKYIDAVGCPAQTLMVSANGFLAWIDYRGVYLWDGAGKPIYCSRPIETLFNKDGELDKAKLRYGWGAFYRKANVIYWQLSHQVHGEQQYALCLDLRLTIPSVKESLGGRVIDGVFIQHTTPFALYAATTYIPSSTYEESFLAGDNAGFMYAMFDGFGDGSSGIDFEYETKFFDLGTKGTTKRYHKIIIWTQDSSDSNLTLDWWTGYKSDEDGKASMSLPASEAVSEALWDLAYWDTAYWNQTVRAYNALVFNLNDQNGNIEGDCLKLRFQQTDANAPITIAGFTVIYTEQGLRK
jgi:hypothetical protein